MATRPELIEESGDRSPPRPWFKRPGLLVALYMAVTTVVMLSPTPTAVAETVPDNPGDPNLVLWVLSWGWRGLRDPGSYFDGNIFWPNSYSYAYHDTLAPAVPLFGVLRSIFGPIAALNLLVVVLFQINLASTYALARHVGAKVAPAAVAAAGFSFSGYSLSHWGHVNLQALGLVPLAFLLYLRTLESPTPWRVLWTVLAAASAFSFSAYYGLVVAVVFVGTLVVGLLRRTWVPNGVVLRLWVSALVGLGVVVVLVPVLLAYLEVKERFEVTRPASEVDVGSLAPHDLVSPAPGTVWKGVLVDSVGLSEHHFFPGATLCVLAVIGLVAWLRGGDGDRINKFALSSIVFCAAVLLVLAAGRTLGPFPGPFGVLQRLVPGLDVIRVPARFVVAALLATALLASIGLSAIVARLSTLGAAIAVIAVALLVAVEQKAPLPRVTFDDRAEVTAVYHALDCLPAGPVVELPMGDVSTIPGAIVEAPRDALSTIDWNPRVNGYSGIIPPRYLADVATFNSFPSPPATARAKELRVRWVVLDVGQRYGISMLSPDQLERITAELPDGSFVRVGEAWLHATRSNDYGALRACAERSAGTHDW